MAVKDLKIDQATGDLAIEGNDLALVSGDAMVVQHMRSRLLLHRGEWPLDTSKGLPWRQWFQAKPPRTAHMRSTIRDELEDVDGVKRIDDIEVAINDDRTATVRFSYTLDSGDVGALTTTI